MAIHTNNCIEAARLRSDAQDLLERLRAGRERIEQHRAETGRRDLVKSVKGSSAMDDAVSAAEEMIDSLSGLEDDRPGVPEIHIGDLSRYKSAALV